MNLVTYDDAAALLDISTDAVRQRAKRGRWRRVRGNDGRTRIELPEGYDDRTMTGRQPDDDRTRPATDRTAALETEIRLLREMLEDMRDDRDRWRGMAERLAERRQVTSDSVSAAIAGMRAAAKAV